MTGADITMVAVFSIIALVLACLYLFGDEW